MRGLCKRTTHALTTHLGAVRAVHIHLPVQAVSEQQVVGELEPVWLHGVARTVVVVAHVAWIEVGGGWKFLGQVVTVCSNACVEWMEWAMVAAGNRA